jgi:protein O-GlcNAc transferase
LFEAWYGLGCADLSLRAYGDAAEALRRAVALRGDADGARCNLAEALFQLGDVDGAVAAYQRAADIGGPAARAVALAGIACIAAGAPSLDNLRVMVARQRWMETQAHGVRPQTQATASSGRKLRIGYLSAFFGELNWMKGYMGVINAHDRARFEIHLLADGAAPSAGAGYADHDDDRIWELGGISNAELARHIADAKLDVLVDLNGYSYQPRLPLFLYRPAPVQMCWVGMFGTTGLREVDWLVGDDAVIPPEEEQYYTERVARVPGTYLAFWPFYPVPDVAPPPSRASRQITFGCLSSAYKLTDPTIAAYAAILRDAPTSHLLLRNRTLDDAGSRTVLLARFAGYGVGADRLTLEGSDAHFEFLHTYDRIDVALDTFPYNGGTTTFEALWQGVPMLTCTGDRWAARTSRSLLRAAGLDDWVAGDMAGFQRAGAALANAPETPDRLAALRATMRERLRASAVCDVTGLCRSLEALMTAAAGKA